MERSVKAAGHRRACKQGLSVSSRAKGESAEENDPNGAPPAPPTDLRWSRLNAHVKSLPAVRSRLLWASACVDAPELADALWIEAIAFGPLSLN